MSIVSVREAPIEDVIKVNDTISEFDVHYTKEVFEARYKDKEHIILVAYMEDQPAGYIIAYDDAGSLYLWMGAIKDEYRKKNVLNALIDKILIYAEDKKYSKLTIKTRNDKRDMLYCLVKCGFNFTKVEEAQDISKNSIYLERTM